MSPSHVDFVTASTVTVTITEETCYSLSTAKTVCCCYVSVLTEWERLFLLHYELKRVL